MGPSKSSPLPLASLKLSLLGALPVLRSGSCDPQSGEAAGPGNSPSLEEEEESKSHAPTQRTIQHPLTFHRLGPEHPGLPTWGPAAVQTRAQGGKSSPRAPSYADLFCCHQKDPTFLLQSQIESQKQWGWWFAPAVVQRRGAKGQAGGREDEP